MSRLISLDEWETEQRKDPEVAAALEELELAYQVIKMRTTYNLTQAELATLTGTTQSSIARLENGSTPPSLSFLRRIAKALGAELVLRIVPNEDY